MNILEIVTMVVLVIIIVGGVSVPPDIHSLVGSVPGTIIILLIVFYLFSVSPILGVFGMIAGYEVIMNTKSSKINPILDELPSQSPFTPTNQFQVTLEETIVNNIVPLVQSVTPKHLNFKYTEDNTYSAANAVNV
jgi:hypothetical protein